MAPLIATFAATARVASIVRWIGKLAAFVGDSVDASRTTAGSATGIIKSRHREEAENAAWARWLRFEFQEGGCKPPDGKARSWQSDRGFGINGFEQCVQLGS